LTSAPAGTPAPTAVNPNASALSTGNEVVLSANARGNASFVAKTRGPSALEQGYAMLLEGRMDDAAAAYGQALRANADERDALLGLAYISQKRGQREEAQSYYRRVLRQEPNNARALAALQALDSGSDATLTASRTGELAARQPDSAAAMAMAGNAFVRDGLLSNAVQAYARAQALEPNNPLHAYNHAVALDRLGRYAPAVVQYERVLTLSATAPVAERAYQIEDVRLRLAQLRQALAAPTESTAP
jgi:tetratricopeptide (TPR) repeat protein